MKKTKRRKHKTTPRPFDHKPPRYQPDKHTLRGNSHAQYNPIPYLSPPPPCRSSIKMGSEFMHQYENDDEVDGGGGAELTNEMRLSHDPKNRKAAKIITKLLKVFYRQWKDTDYFKEKIKKELYISLNKKLDDSLEEMVITKLIVSQDRITSLFFFRPLRDRLHSPIQIKGEGPDIKSIVQQPSEENEFQMDIEISYKGTIYFEVDTAYYLDWPMVIYCLN